MDNSLIHQDMQDFLQDIIMELQLICHLIQIKVLMEEDLQTMCQQVYHLLIINLQFIKLQIINQLQVEMFKLNRVLVTLQQDSTVLGTIKLDTHLHINHQDILVLVLSILLQVNQLKFHHQDTVLHKLLASISLQITHQLVYVRYS